MLLTYKLDCLSFARLLNLAYNLVGRLDSTCVEHLGHLALPTNIKGATTLSITILSIKTLSITTLIIRPLSIRTLSTRTLSLTTFSIIVDKIRHSA